VAHGLHFLHSNNIVHRDIKPENVLRQLNDNGVELFKITDFGLSSNKEQRMMTTKVGTAYYVAPEILDGRVLQEGYDRTVDTWALGLMFDELIHGSPFYNG
jgi:calcium-dependent protein kinase